MKVIYECQICMHYVESAPPEWCPTCGGHRVLFKRLYLVEEELASA
ncbi:MAG: hypothetical protein ABH843_03890 [Candidatus Omnitrophota bacterium]